MARRKKDYWAELDALREQNGGTLKQQSIVDYARDPATALHSKFEWNDARGGEKFRLIQAQQLIRLYVIRQPEAETPTRVIVSLQQDRHKNGPGYRGLNDVLRVPELRNNLLATALMELRAVQRKYSTLQELAEVWSALEQAERRHRPRRGDDDSARTSASG